jgi:hypothetical protein
MFVWRNWREDFSRKLAIYRVKLSISIKKNLVIKISDFCMEIKIDTQARFPYSPPHKSVEKCMLPITKAKWEGLDWRKCGENRRSGLR